jgi:hypothetical protein
MLPFSKLEYGGIADKMKKLDGAFIFLGSHGMGNVPRNENKPE